MNARCEVFGLFARDIPQEGLARMERGRKRQGIVPDFLIPGGGGGVDATLADLKFITGTELNYPRNPRRQERAVDRRAAAVNAEYQRHAVLIDTKYCGIPKAARGQPQALGPVQQRLASFGEVQGWSFGVWGEASDTVHTLIDQIATARLTVAGQQPERQGRLVHSPEAEKAQLVGSLRRQVSLVAVRANARLLISRMESFVGQGAAQAARRRQQVIGLERQELRERQAYALSFSQGRNILRRGHFRLD